MIVMTGGRGSLVLLVVAVVEQRLETDLLLLAGLDQHDVGTDLQGEQLHLLVREVHRRGDHLAVVEQEADDVGRRAVQLRPELLGRHTALDDDGALRHRRVAARVVGVLRLQLLAVATTATAAATPWWSTLPGRTAWAATGRTTWTARTARAGSAAGARSWAAGVASRGGGRRCGRRFRHHRCAARSRDRRREQLPGGRCQAAEGSAGLMATAGDRAAEGSAGRRARSGGQARRPARRPGPGRDAAPCARELRSAATGTSTGRCSPGAGRPADRTRSPVTTRSGRSAAAGRRRRRDERALGNALGRVCDSWARCRCGRLPARPRARERRWRGSGAGAGSATGATGG